MFKNRRRGTFYIQIDFIDEHEKIFKEIMSRCVIVRAEIQDYGARIEYQAISDLFDTVPMGGHIPVYQWIYHASNDKLEVEKTSSTYGYVEIYDFEEVMK